MPTTGLSVVLARLAVTGIVLWATGAERDPGLMPRDVLNGMDSFPLMALPFLLLAWEIIIRG